MLATYNSYSDILRKRGLYALSAWHELGMTGWLCLTLFIPGVNFLILIGLGAAQGTAGPNQYGDDPSTP